MENASDALVMAGQVLIFIIALTVCISSFSTVRTEVNRIAGQNEEIRMAKDEDTYINFIESKKSSSTRVVESETVVSSMYRAIKENYVIYIKFKNSGTINAIKTNRYINTMTATKDSQIKNASNESIIKRGETLVKITIGADTNQEVNKVLKTEGGGKLFETLSGKKFNEYLGEYQKDSAVTTENKEVYRIITYVEV